MPIELLREAENHRIYWYDEDKTIFVIEVTDIWTWENAIDALTFANDTLLQHQENSIFSVLYFLPGVSLMPDGFSLEILRQIIKMDTPSEKLTLIASEENTILEMMVASINQLYGLHEITSKYRFIRTFDHALQMIEDYKSNEDL